MRKLFLFLSLLLSYSLSAQDSTAIRLQIEAGTSLEEVITELETNHGYLFSYKDSDVREVTLPSITPRGSINEILTIVLQNTLLDFKILNQNYIVLTKQKKNTTKEQPLITFCGEVSDSLAEIPLAFATVYFTKSKKGTTTKEDGSFQMAVPLLRDDSIVVSYVGYQEKRFPAKYFRTNPCQKVALTSVAFGNDFVVVTEYLTEGIGLNSNDLTTELRPNKVGILPGQAEPDVLESLQFLPGISSTDGTAANLSIRGGTPDQNLILWEDIPIYHAAHYFGTISAFNPYIIDKVSVYRGGFDVTYGGRVSGVVDLKSEELATASSDFTVGANLLNAYVNGHKSLINNKLKVVFSARRSFSELWRSPAFESLTRRIQQGVLVQDVDLDNLPKRIKINDSFSFFDSNLKLAYQLSPKDELTVSGFYGYNDFEGEVFDDNIKQRQADTLYLSNNGLSVSWKHQWNDRFSSRLLGVHSYYNYDYGYSLKTESQNQNNPGANRLGFKESEISEQQLHFANSYKTAKGQQLKFGYQLTQYRTDFSIEREEDNRGKAKQNRLRESKLQVLYTSFQSNTEAKFGVEGGARLNFFELTNEVFLEPRVRGWYRSSDHLNFQLTAGRYYQYLSQLYDLAGDNASISTPVWNLAGGGDNPIQNAQQLQLGIIYQKNTWLLDMQFYAKNVNQQTSLSTNFNENLTNAFEVGSSSIRGVDLLLKKRWGNFRSWMSYALSKNVFDFPGFFDTRFAAPTDQRHIFKWSNSYTIDQWEFSLGWRISSGRPYSSIEHFEIVENEPGSAGPKELISPVVNEFNSEQLPATHQLDAAIKYSILPKNEKRWKGVLGLSFLNIYNQRNVYNRDLTIRKKPGQVPRLEYTDRVTLGFTPNLFFRVDL